MDEPLLNFETLYGWRSVHPASLDGARESAVQWSVSQFPAENQAACLEHLRREVDELIADPTSAEEMADVFMLLVRAAHNAGVQLGAAVLCKVLINAGRDWGVPDEKGVIEHVRDTRRDG